MKQAGRSDSPRICADPVLYNMNSIFQKNSKIYAKFTKFILGIAFKKKYVYRIKRDEQIIKNL